jgi:hypothetical protein
MGDDLNEFLDEVSSVDDGEGRGRLAEDGDDGFDSEATASSTPSLLSSSKGNTFACLDRTISHVSRMFVPHLVLPRVVCEPK